jgi:hypothetical protein
MSPFGKATVVIACIFATGCAATSERSLAERDTAIFVDGDRLHTGTGATIGSGGGAVGGGSAAPAKKDDLRGNTKPGVDRDGHGPATGAIVDPAGVTEKK